jgi:hypothetical protein
MRAACWVVAVTLLFGCGRTEPLLEASSAPEVDLSGELLLAYSVERGDGATSAHVVELSVDGTIREVVRVDANDSAIPYRWSRQGNGFLSVSNASGTSTLSVWAAGRWHQIDFDRRIRAAQFAPTEDAVGLELGQGLEAELTVVDLRFPQAEVRSIDHVQDPGGHHAFSRDGSEVAYSAGGSVRVARLDRSRAGMPVLDSVALGKYPYKWGGISPDGRWLSVSELSFPGWVLFPLGANTTKEPFVPPHVPCQVVPSPRWMSDDSIVAIHRERSLDDGCEPCELCLQADTHDLLVLDLRASPKSIQLTVAEGDVVPATAHGWATTAAGLPRLAFTAPGPANSEVLEIADLDAGVMVGVAQLTAGSATIESVSLSERGDRIIYALSDDAGIRAFAAFEADGWKPRGIVLETDGVSWVGCSWSPLAPLALCSLEIGETDYELWAFDFSGTAPASVRIVSATEGWIDWDVSRGWQLLAYLTHSAKRMTFVPIDGSDVRLDRRFSLEVDAGEIGDFAWQP